MIEILFIYDVVVNKFCWFYEVVLFIDIGKCVDDYFCKGFEKYGNFNDMFREIGVYD